MTTEQYSIVFDGELMPGMTADGVKDNLARLFKSDRRKIEQLFGRGPVNIKRALNGAEADKYLQALQRAGAKARKEAEPKPPIALSLADTDSGDIAAPATRTQPMECPKCGHAQATSAQCASCGIFIAKYLARQAQSAGTSNHDGIGHPYAPPSAQVAEPMPAHGELKAFTLQGRIGRLRYLAWSMTLSAAALGLLIIAGIGFVISQWLGSVLIGLVGVAFLVVSVQIGVQRLHDIGWSGWFFLLNLVPVIGTFFPLVMLLMPGNGGTNRFGPPQPPNSRSVKILASLWLLVPIISIFAAIAIPAYQQYLQRAGL